MFQDASELIAVNPPARHSGIAVAALGGDGRFAVVVAGFGGPNRVLTWAGGRLRDVAPPLLADPDRPAVGVAAGDLDGDGSEELYVLTSAPAGPPPPDRLFKRHPDGRWEDLFARPENRPVRNLAAGRSVAALDRRGVGRYGFFVANDGHPARLYELGPDGLLADLAPPLGLDAGSGGRGVLAAPLFGAHTDLFCTTEGGPNRFYRNRGDGTFDECAGRLHLADPGEHGRGAAAVDADGDGRLDVCWGNWDGPHRLLVRQPDGTWRDRATPALALPSAARTVLAADFDNDGRDELVLLNLGEPNRVFRFDFRPLTSDLCPLSSVLMLDPGDAAEPGGFGTGAAVADLDGDGVLELLVAHGEGDPHPLRLYKARAAAGNGWLRIRPLTRFGAPARGAVVRAGSGGRVRVRAIDGGGGYLGQSEPVAHFGLGPDPAVEWVSVTWPDGAALTIPHPDVNCTYSVPYPGG